MNTDQNLLFGVLALQLEFIDARQFVDACSIWATRKESCLGDLLLQQGWIDDEAKSQVDGLLERKLRKHRGQARTVLETVADADLRELLKSVADDDIDATVSMLAPESGYLRVSDEIVALGEDRSHYTLSRVHDQGGLGRVWLAHDRRLHRDVALKEIRPDTVSSAQSQQRFVREAQIAGQLQHPNIVPVYELGYDPKTRLPFYTMRFLQGQEFTKAIEEYHGLRKGDRARNLELRRLLNVLVSVCHAVGYAHSKNVIHRDLKPSNVMLGAFGEVIVLDWGLAKHLQQPEAPEKEQDTEASVSLSASAQAEVTVEGQAVGTPAYMAPEQAKGQRSAIDIRTDVYGLGAILYRILTGQRPHRGRETQEILARISEGPTPESRALDPSIPAALNAVCLKAMAKQPSDRYQTAGELAEDLQRWLADEPVSAYRSPWPERAARWCRRHRTFTQTVAAVLLVTSLVATGASILVNRARRAEAAAKNEALLRLGQAVQTVDEMLTGVNLVMRDQPASQPLRQKLLQLAAERYESFVSLQNADVRLRLEHGRTYLRIGDVYRELEDCQRALTAYQQAGEILTAPTIQQLAGSQWHEDLAVYHQKRGELWTELGQRDDALREFEQARERLRELPHSWERQVRLAELDIREADAQQRWGNLDVAARLLASTESALSQSMDDSAAAAPKVVPALARVRSVMGSVLVRQGQHARAAQVLQQTVQAYDQLLDQQPDDRALVEGRAYAELNRAQSLGLLGDPAEEIEAYRSAIADFEAVLESLTDVPSLRENLAIACCGLGGTANRNFQNRESVRWMDSGLAEYERLSNRRTPLMRHYEGLVKAGSVMGSVLAELGDIEPARQNLDSAVTLLVHKLVPTTDECRYHRDLAIASTHLGCLSQQQGAWDQAKTEFELAIRLLREVLEADPTEVHAREALAAAFECLGDLWHEQQRPREAGDEYRRALEQREDPRLPPLPIFQYRKAALLLKFDDAQTTETAVEIASQLHEQYPENGSFRVLLAEAYAQAGHAQSAIELLEATDASVHLGAGPARDFHLAIAYQQRAQAGDDELARLAYDQAIDWMNREAPGNLHLRRLAAQTAETLGLDPPDR